MACMVYFHGACDGITFYMEPAACTNTNEFDAGPFRLSPDWHRDTCGEIAAKL